MELPVDPLTLSEIIYRFVAASIAGAILGIPSQLKRSTAGLRTHALVSLGAAVFCMTGVALVGNASPELLRIIQGIASGVGFIGGAAVLRGDHVIRGINTAASVWIAAAVGCAVGFIESPIMGLLAAAIAALINFLLMELEVRVMHPEVAPPETGESDNAA